MFTLDWNGGLVMQPDMDWLVNHEMRASKRYRRFLSLAYVAPRGASKEMLYPLLQTMLRASDVVAPVNGVLGVVLTETDQSGAAVAFARCQRRIGTDGADFGFATFPQDGHSSELLCARARQRLDRAMAGAHAGVVGAEAEEAPGIPDS